MSHGWVPFIHFWPNINKDSDPGFGSVQPIEYIPLNWVINDHAFYDTNELGKTAIQFLYLNYIGVIPVLLAFISIRLVPRAAKRLMLFFWIAIGLVFLFSSALPFKLLSSLSTGAFSVVRFPSIIASLAVPLILGLAAWGLDRLLKLNWPRIFINVSRAQTAKPLLGLNIAYAIIAVLLIGALNSAYDFNRAWLSTTKVSNPPLIQALKTPATQWVYPPFGQGFWLPFGFDANLKMVTVSRPWNWKDRPMPPSYLEATYDPVNRNSPNYLETIDGINLIVRPENQYALTVSGPDRAAPMMGLLCTGELSPALIAAYIPSAGRSSLVPYRRTELSSPVYHVPRIENVARAHSISRSRNSVSILSGIPRLLRNAVDAWRPTSAKRWAWAGCGFAEKSV